jgi:hypothetical protein
MKRHSVNKRRSVRKFNRHASHTKAANHRPVLQRGGYRL